ncbi:hypothetical protein O3M35_011368 [Rhynocoris fuscipes]|uniref:CRAL-TRIO domain-containing protein n=1 Tax=Rhynocoris fuscipes TaxID=488301 RepID=A0AAW1CVZ9_9HEMI
MDKKMPLSAPSSEPCVKLNGIETVIRHPLDSSEWSPPEISPSRSKGGDSGATCLSDEDDEIVSVFEAVLSPEASGPKESENWSDDPRPTKKKITIDKDLLSSLTELDSPDEDLDEDQILGHMEPLPEYTADEERQDVRGWRKVILGGSEREIDMKVIEPYKRVLSHGGYLASGSHNAIIVFSACFMPHRSRIDYRYVMDNLFCYVVSTLDQLVTDDYVLVYLHGGTTSECMPTFAWLKRCYHMIDRRLRKNLKSLYLVHPTFWLKTLLVMTRPFISPKFSRKIHLVNSLSELFEDVPLEGASIPDRVRQYDRIKQSIKASTSSTSTRV